MSNEEKELAEQASERIYGQIEENMNPGGLRDLWQNIRSELDGGGPQSVGSYLETEYARRKTIVDTALSELASQFEEID